MYRRLVTADPDDKRSVVFPMVGLAVTVLAVALVPWMIQNPELARPYLDPRGKAVALVLGGLVTSGVAVFIAVHVGVGGRLLASIYGRETSAGVVLASPWGVLGYPSQRVVLHPGNVHVHLINEAPAGPMFVHGMQRIYVTQGLSTLHVVSYTLYDDTSRARLADWLLRRGIRAEFDGDQAVLRSSVRPPPCSPTPSGSTRHPRSAMPSRSMRRT